LIDRSFADPTDCRGLISVDLKTPNRLFIVVVVSQFDPPPNFRLMIPVCRVPAEPDVVVKHDPCLLRNPDKPCNWS
jgi:hypothetical protein